MQGQYIGDVPNMFVKDGNMVIDLGAFRYIIPWSVVVPGLQKAIKLAENYQPAEIIPLMCKRCGKHR